MPKALRIPSDPYTRTENPPNTAEGKGGAAEDSAEEAEEDTRACCNLWYRCSDCKTHRKMHPVFGAKSWSSYHHHKILSKLLRRDILDNWTDNSSNLNIKIHNNLNSMLVSFFPSCGL